MLALAAVILLGLPAPLTTYAQGLVWPAENAQLRAAEPGTVVQVAVHTGDRVVAGQTALLLRNDRFETERDVAQARDERQRRSFVALLAGASTDPDRRHGRVAAAVQRQEWQHASNELEHADATLARMTVKALRDGRIELPRAEDLPGRWLKKGELFGHVVTDDAPTLRVVVSQDDIDLVRARLQRVEVRLSGALGKVWTARLVREVPAGDESLPSMALALEGGGLIAVDGRDPARPRALNRIFQFDLELPPAARAAQVGERAHVRFVHLSEPLGLQWARRLRQLLLSQLTF